MHIGLVVVSNKETASDHKPGHVDPRALPAHGLRAGGHLGRAAVLARGGHGFVEVYTGRLVKSYQSSLVITRGVSCLYRRLVTTFYGVPVVAEQEYAIKS